jgi:HD-like signal output (HDOD) protein
MAETNKERLLKRLEHLDRIPTLPAALQPLLRYLDRPLDELDMNQVARMISSDESLASQCLHMANSPLFGRWQAVDSVPGAVAALGLRRMREIALSCCVFRFPPGQRGGLDPVKFWEHSLGCALVSRQFAEKLGYAQGEKAYLAGLLHDLGVLVHLWLMPEAFCEAHALAMSQEIPLHEAEEQVLGMTHAQSGKLLAERWQLPAEVCDTILWHHDPTKATAHRGLVALVSLADLLCRMRDLGFGHSEEREVIFLEEPAFPILLEECPSLEKFDWALFTFELDNYMVEVKNLVTAFYRPT